MVSPAKAATTPVNVGENILGNSKKYVMISIKKPREKHTVKNTNKTSTYFEGVMGFLMIIRKLNLVKMYMITGRSADITEIRTLSPESPKITNTPQIKAVIAERMQTIKNFI